MPDLTEHEILAQLIERLVDCPDPAARERLLVEALHARGWAQSVGLYHGPAGREEDEAWQPSIARGPEDLLPDGEIVRAVFAGELPEELPLGKRVLFGWRDGGRSALAVGGFRGETSDLDQLEALLQAASLVDGVEAFGDGDLLDLLHGPLPHDEALELPELDEFGEGVYDALPGPNEAPSTDLAALLEARCAPWHWALAQRGLAFEVVIDPEVLGQRVEASMRDLEALLDVVLDENLARLRAAGVGPVRIELDRSGAELRLGIDAERPGGVPAWSVPDPARLTACGATARLRTAAFELFLHETGLFRPI